MEPLLNSSCKKSANSEVEQQYQVEANGSIVSSSTFDSTISSSSASASTTNSNINGHVINGNLSGIRLENHESSPLLPEFRTSVTNSSAVTNDSTPSEEAEDEFCVYTYKGGSSRSLADLPASFFEFDSLECNGINSNCQSNPGPCSSVSSNSHTYSSATAGSSNSITNTSNGHVSGTSAEGSRNYVNNNIYSPDMDFLEMDFDPGIPGEDDDENQNVSESQTVEFCFCESNKNSKAALVSNVGNGVDGIPLNAPDSTSHKHILQLKTSPSPSNLPPLRINSPSTSAQLNLKTEPQPHCSKTLFANNNNNNSSSQSAVSSSQSLSQQTPHSIENESGVHTISNLSPSDYELVPRNLPSSPLSPQLFKSLGKEDLLKRLVKSNTLPKMGTHSNTLLSYSSSTSPTVTTPTASESISRNGNFAPILRTSGLSYSVPLMDSNQQISPDHYKAVLMTSPKLPNLGSIDFEIGDIMIWTVDEARTKSLSQVGVSACGATAVLNVLVALGFTTVGTDLVKSAVGTRLRAEHADLPEYLFSRSVAGATHEDLIRALHEVSNDCIYAKFFAFDKRISKDIFCKWLLSWICKGAIPIVTRNLQVPPFDVPDVIPDAWHHQMVFGLSPRGVFLNNPIECVPPESLLPHLISASTLLVRREDVTMRMQTKTDLRKLARHKDPRWNELNVLGQVANMFLEQVPVFNETSIAKRTRTSHITIPAAYKGGVVLSILRSSPFYQLMVDSPELVPP